MSNQPPEDQIARDDRRARTWGDFAKFGVWCLVGINLILLAWGLWGWRNSSNVVGATNAKLATTLDRLNEKLDVLDTSKVNQRLEDLGESQRHLNDILAQSQTDIHREFLDLHATHGVLNAQIAKFGGVTDEARHQIQQNGDAVHTVVLSTDRLVNDQQVQIRNAEQALTRAAEGLSTAIETTNPKIAKILDHLDTVTIDADGTVKGLQPIEQHLAGITANFEAMSLDSRNKLHELFYPAPVHGFWPNVRRTFSYVATPLFEGTRLYFQLHSLSSLPVRLVAPIPK